VDVLEANDEVGGRVRTEVVDGFRCDRGFQLLNPAYPDAKSQLNLHALELRAFGRGIAVRRTTGLTELGLDPTSLRAALHTPYADVRQLLAFARWAAPAMGSVSRLLTAPDSPWPSRSTPPASTDRCAHDVVEPFLAGVLLESAGPRPPASHACSYGRSRRYARGPRAGHVRDPPQLAAALPTARRAGDARHSVSRDGTAWVAQTPQGERAARTSSSSRPTRRLPPGSLPCRRPP
jgi:hypothetical protein